MLRIWRGKKIGTPEGPSQGAPLGQVPQKNLPGMPDMYSTEVVASIHVIRMGGCSTCWKPHNYATVIYKVNDKKMIPSGEIA